MNYPKYNHSKDLFNKLDKDDVPNLNRPYSINLKSKTIELLKACKYMLAPSLEQISWTWFDTNTN